MTRLTQHDEAAGRSTNRLEPTLESYALSFVFVANYWNNHHHLTGPEVLLTEEEERSILKTLVGTGSKEKISVTLHAFSIRLSYIYPWLAFAAFIAVAIMWIVPDKRYGELVKNGGN